MTSPYLTSREAAAFLCYASVRCLQNAIANQVTNARGERIPFHRRGRSLLFSRTALEAWLEAGESERVPAPRLVNTRAR